MLGKVLKYDFKYMGKMLIPLYLLTIVMCSLTRGLVFLSDKFRIFEILSFFTNVGGLILIVASLALTLVMVVRRFYTNLFKEEGYLTNVLPVKINTHIISKFICALVFNILAVLVVVGSLAIMYYSLDLSENIRMILDMFGEFIPCFLVYVVLALQAYEMLICAAYSLGQTQSKNKIQYAVIFGIGLYSIAQVMGVIGIGILLLIKPNCLELLEVMDKDAIWAVLITGTIIPVFENIMYLLVMKLALNKKMDLE